MFELCASIHVHFWQTVLCSETHERGAQTVKHRPSEHHQEGLSANEAICFAIAIPIAVSVRLLHSNAHPFSSVRNDGSLDKVYLKPVVCG